MQKLYKYLLIASAIFLIGSLSVPYVLDLYFHYNPIEGETDWNPVETNAYLLVKPLLNFLAIFTLLVGLFLRHREKKKMNLTEPEPGPNSKTPSSFPNQVS